MSLKVVPVILSIFCLTLFLQGCSSSSGTEEEKESYEERSEQKTELVNPVTSAIFNAAKIEQENEMYSPDVDSTYLYWLDSNLIVLSGSTKCNIFALNVLYESGFKTPGENALAKDLFDTANFKKILPVIGHSDVKNAKKGDLIIWYSHVIIFESAIKINEEEYAIAWWAGTRQPDNGVNIKNNVCYGNYKLDGEYLVRRPIKK